MKCDRTRFQHRSAGKRNRVRQAIKDARRHNDIFGEGSSAAVVGAGYANDLTIVAQIYLAPCTILALPAVDGGVESHAVSNRKLCDIRSGFGDDSGSLMSHHDRRNAPSG